MALRLSMWTVLIFFTSKKPRKKKYIFSPRLCLALPENTNRK
jgi:hypothetical protein